MAEDLTKRYEHVQALDGLALAVRDAKMVGRPGPNGAGRSTTVRVLTTLTKPDSTWCFRAYQHSI